MIKFMMWVADDFFNDESRAHYKSRMQQAQQAENHTV